MPTRSSPAAARTPRSGTALLVLAGLLWGTGGLAGSLLASRAGLQPVAVAAYRLLVGGALITAYAVAAGRLTAVPRTRAVAARVAASGVLLGVFQAAYFAAVEATSVGLATLTTMVAVPVLVTAGAAVLDRRLPTRRAAGSVVIAAGGLVLLLGSPSGTSGNRAAGAGLALIAALGFAVLTLDRRAPLPGLDRTVATGLGFLAGGLLLLPIGLVSGMELPLRVDAVGALVFLGLVPTAIAYLGYFAGLRRAGAAAGVVAVLLEPLTATLLAVLLGRESLGGPQILGALLLLVSIGIQQITAITAITARTTSAS
ncbi:DMT family transporter [Streptomyces sp. DSM 40750]|uniref:DMT family transporter n=1 Tax=Streptomyces sp. DSM 40750 TaxID=2801030 RepID=UPI00214B0425|nr:DMT family transporter [Streptomyces sp. DSM 40750]UUU23682.1 DMT family transporter [Streptomyces sp. DSM 40750]